MPDRSLKVLVVDDEAAMREVLEMRLTEWGFHVVVAGDGAEARLLAERERPDVVISDVQLPELSGLALLQLLKTGDRDRPVILITAYGSIDEAVEAMKLGAHDFLTKPLDYAKLRATLAALAGELERRGQVRHLESALDKGAGFSGIVGRSQRMRELFTLLEAVAASDASVIVTGESGTGKELVARAVHVDRHGAARLHAQARHVVGVHAQPFLQMELRQPFDDARQVDAAMAEPRMLGDEEEATLAFWALGRRLTGGCGGLAGDTAFASGRSHRLHAPRRSVTLGREARHRGADRRTHGDTVRVLEVGVIQPTGKIREDLPVRQGKPMHGAGGQVLDTGQFLDAPLDARERALGLHKGGGRQEHVHVERRQIQVLGDEEIAVGPHGEGRFAHEVQHLGPAAGPQARQRESVAHGRRPRIRCALRRVSHQPDRGAEPAPLSAVQ